MNQNANDFHILLPSNASMNYFPNNTPDHFQTKLAYPITLNGDWECCLSEVTIPGKYSTIHPNYNNFYSIETIENVESMSLTPEFVIPLYNEDYQEFTEEGNYTSDYILELRAGITEVYVYCDIIASSLIGDVSASILKIIPIANEYKEQITKQFTVPLYFPIKKNYLDTIEIELVRSSGTPIKFISGKTNLVLSFRRKTT
ncbi:uncharacterized protein TNCV_411391 [Trichonephila clavipes]|nr:uncharacterized protein TNCV_411391 [Trichonephila clavipes]